MYAGCVLGFPRDLRYSLSDLEDACNIPGVIHGSQITLFAGMIKARFISCISLA